MPGTRVTRLGYFAKKSGDNAVVVVVILNVG